MAYTERPAFIQCFQIVLLSISLALEAYAYVVDTSWKDKMKKHGRHFICLYLVKSVNPELYKNTYANPSDEEKKTTDLEDKNYFEKSIKRGASGEERAALIIISLSIALLIFHLVVACISKNYAYRTKWNAAAQGIIVFSCAFSAIFIAISAHEYDTAYHDLSIKFPECTLLHACSGGVYKNEDKLRNFLRGTEFKNDAATAHAVQDLLERESVCQEFQFKIAAAIICGVIILLSFIIICNAMDLTTIYDEEDIDEAEQKRRQAFHMHALHAKRHMHKKTKTASMDKDEDRKAIIELEKLENAAARAKK